MAVFSKAFLISARSFLSWTAKSSLKRKKEFSLDFTGNDFLKTKQKFAENNSVRQSKLIIYS
jgi:hypothetical protein